MANWSETDNLFNWFREGVRSHYEAHRTLGEIDEAVAHYFRTVEGVREWSLLTLTVCEGLNAKQPMCVAMMNSVDWREMYRVCAADNKWYLEDWYVPLSEQPHACVRCRSDCEPEAFDTQGLCADCFFPDPDAEGE
jgi:hypothetical protein